MSRNTLAAQYGDAQAELVIDALAASERELQVQRSKTRYATRDRAVLLARVRAPDAMLRLMAAELTDTVARLEADNARMRAELAAIRAVVWGE